MPQFTCSNAKLFQLMGAVDVNLKKANSETLTGLYHLAKTEGLATALVELNIMSENRYKEVINQLHKVLDEAEKPASKVFGIKRKRYLWFLEY